MKARRLRTSPETGAPSFARRLDSTARAANPAQPLFSSNPSPRMLGERAEG